jgi:hypothetical protein
MALEPNDLKTILDAIENERSRSSMFNAGQDTGIKDLRDSNERTADAQLQVLKDLVNSERDNTKNFVKATGKAFKDSGLTVEMKNLKDVMLAQDQAAAMKLVASELKALETKKYKSQEEAQRDLDALNDVLKKVGMSLSDFGDAAAKVTAVEDDVFRKTSHYAIQGKKNAKIMEETSDTYVEALENGTRAYQSHTERVNYSRQALSKFGGIVKSVAKEFLKLAEQEQRFQQASATADAGWIEGITSLGINQLEYAKILKNTRIEQLATTGAGVDFKSKLKASADSLEYLTSDLESAAHGAEGFYKNMSALGVSQDMLGSAVLDQTKIYRENYRALGLTVEEFNAFTTELINSNGMRSTLLNLQENERLAYIKNIQQRQSEYITMGYTIERAKELQNTFQALNKMDPKQRMKQAARQRAMMGAMGMGDEGARLFDLQTRYKTMNAKDRADAEKEMTLIQQKAAKQLGTLTGSGASMGQSMVFQTMADKTGLSSMAEIFEVESGKGRKVDQEQLGVLNEINETIGGLLKWTSIFRGAEGSAVGSLGTAALGGVGAYAGVKGASFAASKAASMMGGGGAAAAAATKAAGPVVGKQLGKGAFKAAIKAIPGIGLVASLGYMGMKLAEGDMVGAGMELAAGVSSLLPGIGTTASLGLNAATMARDLTKSTQKAADDAVDDMESDTKKSEYDPQQTLMELNKTMKSLNEYMRSTGSAASDQAEAIRSATTAIKDAPHWVAPSGARATP